MTSPFLDDLKKLIAEEKDRAATLRALQLREKALDEARAKARADLRPKINARLREIEAIFNRCAADMNTLKAELGFEGHVRGLDSDREKSLFLDLRHHMRPVATLTLAVTPAGVATFDPAYTNPFQLLEAPDNIYEATVSKFIASSYHDATG